jgi:hypothetical protein
MAKWCKNMTCGFEQLPRQEFLRNPDLTTEEKAILGVLSSYGPVSHPSIPQIMKDACLGKGSVHRWLESLKQQNVIEWIRGNSHRQSNEYNIKDCSQWRLVHKKDKYRPKRIEGEAPKSTARTGTSPHSGTPNISIINNTNSTGSKHGPLPSNESSMSISGLTEKENNQPEVHTVDCQQSYRGACGEAALIRDQCREQLSRIQAGERHLIQSYEDLRRLLISKIEEARSLCPPSEHFLGCRIPPSLAEP